MNKSTQEITTVLQDYVTGLDTDGLNMWVMTLENGLYQADLAANTWQVIPLSPDAWAGCFDGTSYWYADVNLETVQELILP
jgi:hypothetical protein